MNTSKIVAEINSIPDCQTLQNYATEVITQAEKQLLDLELQVAKMILLSNPVTFIAEMIKQITDEITLVQQTITDLTSGIAAVTVALNNKAHSLTNCNIHIP
jgi:prephenate dehydrogenase